MTTRVEQPVIINLPREKCWEIMQDISIAHKYVPGIIKTQMHTEQLTGVGASRRVFSKFSALDETVVEWNEGYGFKIKLHDGKKAKPFPDAFFTYKLEDSVNNTLFTAVMEYRLPGGFIGALVDKLLISHIVSMQIKKVSLAVKEFYENQ